MIWPEERKIVGFALLIGHTFTMAHVMVVRALSKLEWGDDNNVFPVQLLAQIHSCLRLTFCILILSSWSLLKQYCCQSQAFSTWHVMDPYRVYFSQSHAHKAGDLMMCQRCFSPRFASFMWAQFPLTTLFGGFFQAPSLTIWQFKTKISDIETFSNCRRTSLNNPILHKYQVPVGCWLIN